MQRAIIAIPAAALGAGCTNQFELPLESSVDSTCLATGLPECEAGIAATLHSEDNSSPRVKAYLKRARRSPLCVNPTEVFEPADPKHSPKLGAEFDRKLYKARSGFECTFNLLNQARRLATRRMGSG